MLALIGYEDPELIGQAAQGYAGAAYVAEALHDLRVIRRILEALTKPG